jgi:hypothetical protein
MTGATPELHRIELLGLPVALHARTQEHNAELMREMYLISHQVSEPDDAAVDHQELPARLLAVVAELGQRFAGFTTAQDLRLIEAANEGLAELDLVYGLPTQAASAAQHLSDVFDEADEFCLAGQHLLTLATPADLVLYRHWFLSQLIEQLRGIPATSWHDWVAR